MSDPLRIELLTRHQIPRPFGSPVELSNDPVGRSDPFGGPEAPSAPGGPNAGTSLLEREETREQLDDGDHDRFAHYVRKNKIMASAVNGTPVIALCGKVWVPGRDPDKYPICPTCKHIYEGLKAGGDGNGPGGKGPGSNGPGFGGGSGGSAK